MPVGVGVGSGESGGVGVGSGESGQVGVGASPIGVPEGVRDGIRPVGVGVIEPVGVLVGPRVIVGVTVPVGVLVMVGEPVRVGVAVGPPVGIIEGITMGRGHRACWTQRPISWRGQGRIRRRGQW